MEKQENKRSKVVIGIIISFCILLVIYLSMSIYFKNHFYFGSVINGINVSGQTVEEAEKQISSKIESYTLELEERENVKEQINSSDIELKYNSNSKIKELKDNQQPFSWIFAVFNEKDSKIPEIITYNEQLLKKSFNRLSCLNGSNIVEPKNASFEYTDSGYKIVNEVYGNKVNKDILYDNIVQAILYYKTKINLEGINCYENPKYTINSPKVINAKKILDKYTSSVITYKFGDNEEVVNGPIIAKMLKVNENCEVVFDEKEVQKYINTLGNTYNTFGKIRNFITSMGKIVKVSGGNYGWLINTSKETSELIDAIKEGESKTKEPIYTLTAKSRDDNDIGNTYVEINMTKQHVWFYKNGSIVVEGDVVTGNTSRNCGTPVGTYRLNYKQKDATLKGQGYASPVNFWMPFNGGIGIHDASWRYAFGGEIYKTNGSHGCVNAPYYLAQTIFNNIEADTPIICYFE